MTTTRTHASHAAGVCAWVTYCLSLLFVMLVIMFASEGAAYAAIEDTRPVATDDLIIVDYYSVSIGAWHCLTDGLGYTGAQGDGSDDLLRNVRPGDLTACDQDSQGVSDLYYADAADSDANEGRIPEQALECSMILFANNTGYSVPSCESLPTLVMGADGFIYRWEQTSTGGEYVTTTIVHD